ncbi:hypothetical protein [Pseudomonas sp.]|uniref:hypothetical protein n=1 Tax=Pseudomonas sp. TaxID=306 RepID=UPI002896A2DF|nr:hypothetical protein [Pseudomonas sp.]
MTEHGDRPSRKTLSLFRARLAGSMKLDEPDSLAAMAIKTIKLLGTEPGTFSLYLCTNSRAEAAVAFPLETGNVQACSLGHREALAL